MGFLDSIISAAQNLSQERGQAPTGGNQAQHERSVLDGIVDMFKNSGSRDIVNRFNQQGLGNIINSWIGTGSNSPISIDQIRSALGSDRIRQLAQRAGIPEDKVTEHLRELLPGVVDRATPQGTIDHDDGDQGRNK